MLLKLIFVAMLSLVQAPAADEPDDGVEVTERYTLRVKKPGRSGNPSVEDLRVSPDGKHVAIATRSGLVLARTSDGEISSRINFSGFSLGFSADSQLVYCIGARDSKLFQVSPPGELPTSYSSSKGYLGISLQEKNGKVIVASVEPNGPAASSGLLKPGAEIIGVGEGAGTSITSIVGRSLDRVLPMLDGPTKTKLTLSVIPKGKIDESSVTLTRMTIMGSGEFKVPEAQPPQPVAWCLSDDFHEFRSARSGSYIASIRCEQIDNTVGTRAVSRDGRWFGFVAAYKDFKNAKVQPAKNLSASDESEAPSSTPVFGPATYKLGYEQSARRVLGIEIYDVQSRDLVSSFPVATDELKRGGLAFRGVELSPEKKQAYILTTSTFHVYDTNTGERIKVIRPAASDDSVDFSSLSVSGNFAAIGDTKGNVRIVNIETEQVVELVRSRETERVTHVALSNDAKLLSYHAGGVAHVVHLQIAE